MILAEKYKKRLKLCTFAIAVIFASVLYNPLLTVAHTHTDHEAIIYAGGESLPVPGNMVELSEGYQPAIIEGLKIYPKEPFRFDFIVDRGDESISGDLLKQESTKLIKYFLTSLTIPQDQLWVNLSPYEEDRIIADGLAQTEMGRDLLAQDYVLKQVTASLMYPEKQLGEDFWKKLYEGLDDPSQFSQLKQNTFHKIWILPDKVKIYQNGEMVYIVESKLKVLLEDDYLAMKQSMLKGGTVEGDGPDLDKSSTQTKLVRELILPTIEKEVNMGKNFAPLRQMVNSLILAIWYKENLQHSIIGKAYIDQHKMSGIEVRDEKVKKKIYQQYVNAFEKGVYDYIREDYDSHAQKVVPRHYFSGGFEVGSLDMAQLSGIPVLDSRNKEVIEVDMTFVRGGEDLAMKAEEIIAAKEKSAGMTVDEGIAHLVQPNRLFNRYLKVLGRSEAQLKVDRLAKKRPDDPYLKTTQNMREVFRFFESGKDVLVRLGLEQSDDEEVTDIEREFFISQYEAFKLLIAIKAEIQGMEMTAELINFYAFNLREILELQAYSELPGFLKRKEADSAMKPKELGGIDLSAGFFDFDIEKDKEVSFEVLPEHEHILENLNIKGINPVIINMVPMGNVPLFLGLDVNKKGEPLADSKGASIFFKDRS